MQQNKQFVKTMLSDYNIKPIKRLGQNFLISQSQINKIIKSAGLTKQDIVLEIGPGLGGLTLPLAKEAKQVIAIEKDKGLAVALRELLKRERAGNVEVLDQDILNFQSCLSADRFSILPVGRQVFNLACRQTGFQFLNYKVAANLPYNIAAAVVMKFLEAQNPPQTMVVLLQKEVGQRMVAKPPKMEKLAVFCQFYSQVQLLDYINKESFFPKPKVDSALMLFRPKPKPKINLALFAKIVKAGFQSPRKTLLNNLSRDLCLAKDATSAWLLQNKINPSQRPQTLSVPNWLHLTQTLPHFSA